jgi:CheY-like chemotaxis protein
MSGKPSNQEVVLVVEDEVLIRMTIAQYLRDCGYKVIEAASADEAMAVLQHAETRMDVVFSDIEMPGSVDGFGLSKWIRVHRPGLDVILAGTVPRAVTAASELCEQGPVPKPYVLFQSPTKRRRYTIISAGCWRPARLPAGTEEQPDFSFEANATPPRCDEAALRAKWD